MTPVRDAHARRRLQLYRCHCRIAYKLIIYLVKITAQGPNKYRRYSGFGPMLGRGIE
jgi:hypothetical protein